MFIDTLVGNPWLVAGIWAVLSIFDFSATMVYSKAYKEFLSENITYEGGMELNPAFEKDVQQLRWFSPRYIISMLTVALLVGWVGSWFEPLWFEALAGAAILLVLITDLRHLENLSVVWFMKSDPSSFKGRIEQSYALSAPYRGRDVQHRRVVFDRLLFGGACLLFRWGGDLHAVCGQALFVGEEEDIKF